MPLAVIDNLIHSPNATYPDAIKVALGATAIVILLHAVMSMMRGKGESRPQWGWWSRLVYLGTVTGVAILGATSIYAVLAHGHMEEWFLLVHLTGAGMFTACLALVALTFAHRNRFGHGRIASNHEHNELSEADTITAPFGGFAKLTFWLILLTGLLTAATMLFSMLPIMGTHEMEQMLTIHRYAGLALVVVTIMHVYLIVMGRLGRA